MMRAMSASRSAPPDPALLARFGLAAEPVRPAASGLINATWHVRSLDGEPRVLQRVNPIFPGAVNRTIDVVTRHLARQGLPTPLLVPAPSGELWLEEDGAVWRVLTEIAGTTYDAAETPRRAAEAGRVLGRFHRAVSDLDYVPAAARLGVHDTARHVRTLREALAGAEGHRDYAAIAPLAAEVLERAAELPPLPQTRERLVHGDPKISNIVFERGTDRGICLIDLDTIARMPVALELGDALRSWCNPATEDARAASFSEELFAAAIEGYAEEAAGILERDEMRAIPVATLTIATELAARFCTDAIREQYFAWDPSRYASASEHNRARARGQLALARDVAAALPRLDAIVARAF